MKSQIKSMSTFRLGVIATVLAVSTVWAGNFMPVQSYTVGYGSSGNTTICGQTISKT